MTAETEDCSSEAVATLLAIDSRSAYSLSPQAPHKPIQPLANDLRFKVVNYQFHLLLIPADFGTGNFIWGSHWL